MPTPFERTRAPWLASLLVLIGCGGGPSDREIKNARAFEALLTAISLENAKELEGDARLIVQRHDSGELSDASYRPLLEIIEKARAKDWAGAEGRAYEFRARFGDEGSYFK